MTKRERQTIKTTVGYDYQRLTGYEPVEEALRKLDLWEAETTELIEILQAERRAIRAEKRRRVKDEQVAEEARRVLEEWRQRQEAK